MSSTHRFALVLAALLAGAAAWNGCAPTSGGTTEPDHGPPLDDEQGADGRSPRVYGYRVVERFPHDRKAYTQGLLWHDGHLYESTGRPRESFVRKVELKTGKVLRQVQLPDELFGEGLALFDDRFIQLTWEDGVAMVWDARTFVQLDRFEYEGEGWGLTRMGDDLVMSDGSSHLQVRDPDTFELKRRLAVKVWSAPHEAYVPVSELNELEFIDGELWANIYQRELIARIDPETGYVAAWIDFSGLLAQQKVRDLRQDVQNGIAHDPETGRLFITGKYWPNLYQIELVEQ